jgi:Pyridoxamine 5'-phosphate oxidase
MEVGAPHLARLGMARLDATRVAMLGTVRHDGSPRISPVEPYLADGCLLVGAMAWSAKAADLGRDPRYVLHSAVTDPDSGEGELKLHGRAARASPALRRQAAGGWWSGQPAEQAVVFVLGIDQAVFVEWDTEHGVMTVHRWSPQGGYSHGARTYP